MQPPTVVVRLLPGPQPVNSKAKDGVTWAMKHDDPAHSSPQIKQMGIVKSG